jgi:hypothetical protein
MTEASEGEDLDFLGDSSMKDLALRMDEIDKAIEAINEVDKGSPQKKEGSEESPAKGSNYYETPEEATVGVQDVVVDDDDDDDADAGLEDLQKEMKQFEANQEQAPAVDDEIVTATCVKPTVTSSIGISMKTSKGITRIVAVNPSGLLANSSLRPGLQLIQVNDVNVRNAKHAKFIIDNHPGSITLVAKPTVT